MSWVAHFPTTNQPVQRFIQFNSGPPPLHEIPVVDFGTQIGSNVEELIKTVFKSKFGDSSTGKSTTFKSKNDISISGDSPNERTSNNVRPNNNDPTHFVTEKSDEPAKDDDMVSS